MSVERNNEADRANFYKLAGIFALLFLVSLFVPYLALMAFAFFGAILVCLILALGSPRKK